MNTVNKKIRIFRQKVPFGASQMHQAPIFRPLDVRLAVSDVLRSTTLSVLFLTHSVVKQTPIKLVP